MQTELGGAAARESVGRVVSVSGSKASVGIFETDRTGGSRSRATVGKFLGIPNGGSIVIGLITSVAEQVSPAGAEQFYRAVAHLDLVGEIAGQSPGAKFQRGITNYPGIGDRAVLMTAAELRVVYGAGDTDAAHIGQLQQDPSIGAYVRVDEMLGKHFAILGTTGVGKSSGVAIILRQLLEQRPNLRTFLIDPHNEYGHCFGDKAHVLTPRNLRLPFWLFNFEEISDIVFGGRPGLDEELEILSDVIPLAKGAYLQYRGGADRVAVKRKDAGTAGFTADTPVPYRFEDLVNLIDERMGKLENRSSRTVYYKLLSRLQAVRNDPRYAFMFENANIGGDTMADILAQLFRLPAAGKPMTIMQMAGFPTEVIDAVVSVLTRMAFDFGLWSDGIAPLLFVCEEAHCYAPADTKVGFGPTRRSLARIAKEGRKYGVFLGLVTQRPAEIDPTIISQCNTLFVMRMSNDRDQNLISCAVPDAAANLLSFVPSLGTREVFAFGSGFSVPTRLTFMDLPRELRPNSEAAGDTRSDAGANANREMIAAVIDRWRGATMSNKSYNDEAEYTAPAREEAPSLQPQAPGPSPHRSSLLRRPLDAALDLAASIPRRP